MLIFLLACARPPTPAPPVEPLPVAYHTAMAQAASARVPDPLRGGPPPAASASPLPPFTGVSRASATYVGTEACAACHPAEATVWASSGHSHAYATLQANQASFNPDCLGCHVIGLGHPGGFASLAATPQLVNVGCEACHGPGSDHIAAPAAGYGALPTDGSACVACHTHDTSPDFRWESRWQDIAHGPTSG